MEDDLSVIWISEADRQELGINPEKDIPFFTMLPNHPREWWCLKREVPGFLHIPTEPILFGAVNGCMRQNPEICPRELRDKSQGKAWGLCDEFHTEMALWLTALVYFKKITPDQYTILLHRFQRKIFGQDRLHPDYKAIEEFLALIPNDVRKLLVGSRLTLPGMTHGRGFICLGCGVIVKRLKIWTPEHLFIARPGHEEPNTGHLATNRVRTAP